VTSAARAVLFDLDGTLLDSIELIRLSWLHCLEQHGRSHIDVASLLSGMGTPLLTQMRAIAESEEEALEMIRTYRRWNDANHDLHVRAYPGVVEAIEELEARGSRVAVVTSKGRSSAERALRWLGLERLLPLLVSADDVALHKPDPTPVLHGLELLGVVADRASSIYVGDAPVDLLAGRAAGVLVAAVTWGAFPAEALEEHGPDWLLTSPAQLGSLTDRPG